MDHLTTLVAVFHIIVALILITFILLQDSKGGGMGGAFGGGGSQTLFGATGAANFLVKVTRGLAVVFMVSCMGLTYMLSHKNNRSVVDVVPSTPATPLKGEQPIENPASPTTPNAAPNPGSPAGAGK